MLNYHAIIVASLLMQSMNGYKEACDTFQALGTHNLRLS